MTNQADNRAGEREVITFRTLAEKQERKLQQWELE